MHDGRLVSLEAVLEHYNRGGEAHPQKDGRIRPLGLTASEMNDLMEFLRALTDSAFIDLQIPSF
jgi:cytochrome c peroxidase